MACTYQFEHPEFGVIDVYESARCKRISIRILFGKKIRVSTLPRTPESTVLSFINRNVAWIRTAFEKLEQKASQKIIFVPGVQFSTREHELQFTEDLRIKDGRLRVAVTSPKGGNKGKIDVLYPPNCDLTTDDRQQLIHKAIDFALKNEAKRLLPNLVNEIARRNGLKFSSLDFRNTTSQWGSCSTNDRICLNIQLMRLPDDLVEYVIVHELCHTLEHNHSPRFWAHVDRILNGQAKNLRSRLKKFTCKY